MRSTRSGVVAARQFVTSTFTVMTQMVTPFNGGAQSVSIPSRPACETCRIALDSVLTIGDPDGSGFGSVVRSIARTERGEFIIASEPGPGITLFGADGRAIRRIGRAGDGPGEYREAAYLALDSAGRVHVFDRPLGRHSVFALSGEFVGATGLAVTGVMGAVLLPDGSVVLNASARDRVNAGYALLKVDRHGAVVGRADENTSSIGESWWLERSLSVSPSGRVFAAHTHQYVVDIYRPDLTLELRITRDATWFVGAAPGTREISDGRYDVPPTSRVIRAWEGEGGLIWVAVVVRSPQWQPVTQGPTALMRDSPLLTRPRYETIVEVIDPFSKQVVAREHYQNLRSLFLDGYLATINEDQNGSQHRVIRRWRLVR